MRATNSVLACLAVVTVACGGPSGGESDLEQRRAEVARDGAAVMPFDLERTTHVFEKHDGGGRQTVLADLDAPEQVAPIRRHLAEEAERFARGDFHDPEMVHGDDMAGLHSLVTGYEGLTITYRDVDRGAEIEYTSEDPELITAIHLWFDAQLRDHGDHAQPRPNPQPLPPSR